MKLKRIYSGLVPFALSALFSCNALAASDEVVSNLFLDLKNFLGLSAADEREYQSRLRAVPPPYYEESAASGAAVKKYANIPQTVLLDNLGSEIQWNILQPAESINNSNMVDQHLLGFCTTEEKNAGFCNLGVDVAEGGAADLLASSLLSNSTFTAEQQTIAITYINNLTNPVPLPLPSNIFVGDEYSSNVSTIPGSPLSQKSKQMKIRLLTTEGIRALAARYKQTALLSVAQNALHKIVADRIEVPGLGDELGLKGKSNVSIFEATKIEANRRYLDSDWHNKIYEVPQEALLREIANMQAFQLALDFKRYEQEQVLATLLAAQVANSAQFMGQSELAAQSLK